MSCLFPLDCSFDTQGKITFSPRKFSKEFEPFKVPCRKCIPCRLDQAREKSIRCWHESQMHEKNIFLTLTYSDEHLSSPKLIYRDWQLFMKSLRQECPEKRLSVMVTGEYGEKTKRPHWHAIIFGYAPSDAVLDRKTDLGENVFKSKTIDTIWAKGRTEFGSVTIESAGYVARYAAKKLVHGRDQDHDFKPLHRTSCKNPIGRSWIERYWKQTFERGYVVLPNGKTAAIPRYYEDWYRKQNPTGWIQYATTVKKESTELAKIKIKKEKEIFDANLKTATPHNYPQSRSSVKHEIQEQKHNSILKGLKIK